MSEEIDVPVEEATPAPHLGKVLRDWLVVVLIALGAAMLVRVYVLQQFYISGPSMQTTLLENNRVLVNKLSYRLHDVHRGDVVVFRDPDNWLPEIIDYSTNKYLLKAKGALVAVGVLPNPAKQYLVKRVVGVGGDRVVCCTKDGKLTINGVEVTEPYIFAGNKPSEMNFDVTVPKGKLWVMGDHRGASADSRYHQDDINKGFVPVSKVTGRVVAVIWPFKNITYVPKVDVLKK